MPRINIEEGLKNGTITWFNKPINIKPNGESIQFTSLPDTDFWQNTHYGFCRNTGHCMFLKSSSNFTLQTHVTYKPLSQYDQAGLVVYFSPEKWAKTSVEGEIGEAYNLGSVITNNGYSDWATQPYLKEVVDVEFKIERSGSDFMIFYRMFGDEKWIQIRMGHISLEKDAEMSIGLYSCTPKEGGFEATFHYLEIN